MYLFILDYFIVVILFYIFIIYGCLFNSLFLVCFFHVESIFYLSLNTIFHFKRGVIKVYLLYWILSFNYFSIILFLIIGLAVVIFYNSLVDIKLTILCWLMVLVLLLVNSCVIHFSINYLSIIEFYLFLIYIILFQLSMNFFTLSYDFIFIFLNWDIIGLISYLLINFWSSKSYCGIQAVIYNKCGDCFFLLILAFSFINYCNHLALDLFMGLFSFSFKFDCFFSEWFSLSLLFIYFSKSAQFPFSSWLLNAMSAPTPISALLHSSTMVIAGIYFAIILDSLIMIFIWRWDLFFIIILILPIYSLLLSLIMAFYLSDIKSIIACSTINQISYMFLVLLIFPLLSIFHFLIHALFKSLLFLLAGSLIHIQSNFQSLYKIKVNNYLIKIQAVQLFIKIGFLILTLEGLGQCILCGILFIILQCKEFLYSYFSISDCMIGCIFYFTTGLHGIHVIIGCFGWMLIICLISFPILSITSKAVGITHSAFCLIINRTCLIINYQILHRVKLNGWSQSEMEINDNQYRLNFNSTIIYFNPDFFIEFGLSILLCSYYWHFVDWIWLFVFLVYFTYILIFYIILFFYLFILPFCSTFSFYFYILYFILYFILNLVIISSIIL